MTLLKIQCAGYIQDAAIVLNPNSIYINRIILLHRWLRNPCARAATLISKPALQITGLKRSHVATLTFFH